jgi:acyl transferase domain-containing protein
MVGLPAAVGGWDDSSAVAVIGVSCRFPGAPDPGSYWALLREGRDAVGEMSPARRALAGLAPETQDSSEGVGARLGGFIDHVDGFDARFFEISPHEADSMDPQQRLALELGWAALEDAAVAPLPMVDAPVGVFVGATRSDYAALADRLGLQATDRHAMTGLSRSLIANRLSYALGLTGPSMTVDAAQASSLVAVHLACESIRRGESRLALAGGVHLNLDPLGGEAARRLGALSPDGRCHTFDAGANGYVRGEGGGLVVLKPLRAARADGDSVYCVIRGSAVNNDGATTGLTVPKAAAQARAVVDALGRAGLRAAELDYVELHGTGTPVGDPIEAAGLGKALGGAPGAAPLRVGSVKTNIGHLEAAAGIAGLIKTALAIRHREVPASLNFSEANPGIPLDQLGLEVQCALEPWPARGELPVAGVSSFGIGGTNCHVVVTGEPERPAAGPSPAAARPSAPTVLTLAAKGEKSLRGQAAALAERFRADPGLSPRDLAFSLATTRTAFGVRAAAVGSDRDGLLAGLDVLARGERSALVARGTATVTQRAAFLFPGQGHQWAGMGRDLLRESPLFAERIAACEAAFAPFVDWSLTEVLAAPEGTAPDDTEIVQPVLFAVMVALAQLWEAQGVHPRAVLGHSQGEVAAAHVAGALTLEDAARVVCRRARLLGKLAGGGTMVALSTTAAEAEELLAPYGEEASLAAVNGPGSMVVSGTPAALSALLGVCAKRGVRTREVPVDYAAHSAQVEGLRDELLAAFAPISPRPGEIPFYSTVTGTPLDTTGLDAEYWYRNTRETVRFEAATAALIEAGQRLFLEVGAHPVLAFPLGETAEEVLPAAERVRPLFTLRRGEGDLRRFALSLGEAHSSGVEVDWEEFFVGEERRRVPLPTYSFRRRSHWLRGGDAAPRRDAAVPASADEPAGERPGEPAELPAWGPTAVLDLVVAEVADILGFAPGEIDRRQRFKELGLDSLGAVELRDRLRAATGVELPRTVIFDHPTSTALANRLSALVGTGDDAPARPVPPSRRPVADEPIAIVGMACRYPGGIASPEDLWRLVAAGGDAIGPFPTDRGWDLDRLLGEGGDRRGTSDAREGGFLAGAADFDADFFGISPREALAMDPQQRQLLEACWEALERAAIDPASLAGTATGVFAGVSAQDYTAGLRSEDPELDGFVLTGSSPSVLSGRVAYVLGLEGPALSIDTACSSSLVALHLAAGALRSGECTMALAGGATVLGSAGIFTEFSRQGGLAPDGRSKSFAAAADGVGWAEGVGVLVLERLSDARAAGRRVLATIRGSAVNQDGASNGLTAPSGPAQERVIGRALAVAGLSPADVDAVEAHGTGTALGDPIEAGALLAAYGADRGDRGPLRLGSLKSNIGHAQAAAGVAGVIKMVEALRHGELPATIHLDEPSPAVDWEAGGVELLREAAPWPPTEGRPRRAGVSSFGISGTNAHLILEEAGPQEAGAGRAAGPARPPGPLPGVLALPLSARSAEALRRMAADLAAHLRRDPGLDPADVSLSLAGRTRLAHRAVLTGAGRGELLAGLDSLARGEGVEEIAGTAPRPVFVLPGQGSQWPGMARGLHRGSPVFAAALEECDRALAPFVDWSLPEVLAEEDGARAGRLDVVQPVLFAVMVSLARLWEACGVSPAALLGHSQGEIAAAHLAGALTLEDAARVVALRARAMARIAGRGGMLSLALGARQAEARLAPFGGALSLAAVNGPGGVVVSGEPAALGALARACEADGVRTREVAVDYAAHSAQVEALRTELLEGFAPVVPRRAAATLLSTVTGEEADGTDLGAGHWYRNLRETVLFEPALRELVDRGERTFLEISPHPVLALPLGEILEGVGEARVLGTLRRGEGGPRRFLDSLAAAWRAGVEVDWAALVPGASPVELPTYPFRRERFWLLPGVEGDPAAVGQAAVEHPFLGAVAELPADQGLLLTGRLSIADHPWLADHAVLGTAILPGTALLELALRAGEEVGARAVRELTLQAPVTLPEDESLLLAVRVGPAAEDGSWPVTIATRPAADDEAWTTNATGLLDQRAATPAAPPASWPPAGAEPLAVEDIYARLAEAGFDYGPTFRGLRRAWGDDGAVWVEVELAEDRAPDDGFALHPALLDSALHAIAAGATEAEGPRVPFVWQGVTLHASAARVLRALVTFDGEAVSIVATDAAGAPVISVEALATGRIDPAALAVPAAADRALHSLAWREAPAGDPDGARVAVALLGEPGLDHDLGVEVFARHPGAAGPSPDAVRSLAEELLGTVRSFLAAPEHEGSRLVVLTRGAVAIDDEETPDPASAAALGLLASAASEHPGRIACIDLDRGSAEALPGALASTAGEPLLALRAGRILVPRLRRAEPPPAEAAPLDPDRTVLITGAPGALGSLVARHLAEGGARHLVLASRRGPRGEGATELRADLEASGGKVEIVACDVADPAAVDALVASIDTDHPLGTVVHCAGVLDDATVLNLDRDRLERVLAPKVGGAWNLHRASADLDLERFVLFSSIAGVLGGPGQANYAAANAYLDALARSRAAEGLPATAIAWGLWEAGMGERLTAADRARITRAGLEPIAAEAGLAILDRALASPLAALVAAPTDAPALRRLAGADLLPPLFRDLVRVPRRETSASRGDLGDRLAGVPVADRGPLVLALVGEHVAAVLGHAVADAVDPDRAFRDLGFDSLAAVELRNRLGAATGLRLPVSLVFDHPTTRSIAGRLLDLVDDVEGEGSPGSELFRALAALEAALPETGVDATVRDRARVRLQELSTRLDERSENGGEMGEDLGSLPPEELFDLIDRELER